MEHNWLKQFILVEISMMVLYIVSYMVAIMLSISVVAQTSLIRAMEYLLRFFNHATWGVIAWNIKLNVNVRK